MTHRCPGPVQDDTGHPACRYDWTTAPPEGMTWEGFCAKCRADRERLEELRGDCRRDDG